MFPEPFVSRAKAPPAKRSEKGDGDENDYSLDEDGRNVVFYRWLLSLNILRNLYLEGLGIR